MRRSILLTILVLAQLFSCGNKASFDDSERGRVLQGPDTTNIVEMAKVMERDIKAMLKLDDIQSTAALCQEAQDNITYFLSSADTATARLYAEHIRAFVKKNEAVMNGMAEQNYVIRQLLVIINDLSEAGGQTLSDINEPDPHPDLRSIGH